MLRFYHRVFLTLLEEMWFLDGRKNDSKNPICGCCLECTQVMTERLRVWLNFKFLLEHLPCVCITESHFPGRVFSLEVYINFFLAFFLSEGEDFYNTLLFPGHPWVVTNDIQILSHSLFLLLLLCLLFVVLCIWFYIFYNLYFCFSFLLKYNWLTILY